MNHGGTQQWTMVVHHWLIEEIMSQLIQMKIRIPEGLKAFIEDEARKNVSSQNSEVVRCIRSAMKKSGAEEAATSPRPGHSNSLDIAPCG